MEYKRASIEPLYDSQMDNITGGFSPVVSVMLVVFQGVAVIWALFFW